MPDKAQSSTPKRRCWESCIVLSRLYVLLSHAISSEFAFTKHHQRGVALAYEPTWLKDPRARLGNDSPMRTVEFCPRTRPDQEMSSALVSTSMSIALVGV